MCIFVHVYIFQLFFYPLETDNFFSNFLKFSRKLRAYALTRKKNHCSRYLLAALRLGLFFAAVSSREMLTVDSRIDKSWSVRASRGDTLCRVERERKRERVCKDEKCVAYAFARETCI